jgi:hypothetical protein
LKIDDGIVRIDVAVLEAIGQIAVSFMTVRGFGRIDPTDRHFRKDTVPLFSRLVDESA